MKFEMAYNYMLKGEKIKRPCFNGYWYIDGVSGKLTIHLVNGEEITDGDLSLTVSNTLADDWMIVRKEEKNEKAIKEAENIKYKTLEKILDEFAEDYIDEIKGR